MSLEDDTDTAEIELRDLVTQALEENGLLSKIRAQLRAGLYLALENDINMGLQETFYNPLKSKLDSTEIKIIFCIVREFLEYFELDFTCAVFEKETLIGTNYNYESREKLIQNLDIGIDTFSSKPLLLEILNIARSSFNLSFRDSQHEIKCNNSLNKSKNANSTYDIIKEKHEDRSFQADSSADVSEVQHVIDVKAVPKEKETCNSYEDSVHVSQNSIAQSQYSEVQNGNETENSLCTDNKSWKPQKISQKTQSVLSRASKSDLSKKSSGLRTDEYDEKFEPDDTYEGTSSIAEDSVISNREQQNLIDFDKTLNSFDKTASFREGPSDFVKSLIDFDKSFKASSNNQSSPVHIHNPVSHNLLDQTLEQPFKSPSKVNFSLEPSKDKKIAELDLKISNQATVVGLNPTESTREESPQLQTEKRKLEVQGRPKSPPLSGFTSPDSVQKDVKKRDASEQKTKISITANSPELASEDLPKSPRDLVQNERKKRDKSEKIEKLKPMSGLTSLSDLPPLQVNKIRNSDTALLPSLYSRDFRGEKSLKEIDKLLDPNYDSLDNYEEDFMSSGSFENAESELSNIFLHRHTKAEQPNDRPKAESKVKDNNSEEAFTSRDDSELKSSFSSLSKTKLKAESRIKTDHLTQNPQEKTGFEEEALLNHSLGQKSVKIQEKEQDNCSNVSKEETRSISEDFDINSNLEDLLKSSSSSI